MERDRIQVGPPRLERGSLSAAHTSQHPARFRKLGKRCFPNFRREANGQQKRWEAKRSGKGCLLWGKGLTAGGFPTASGSLRERLAAQRSYRRPAALRDLRNVPFPKSTESRDRLLWRRSESHVLTWAGRLGFCLAPFSWSAALYGQGPDLGGAAPKPLPPLKRWTKLFARSSACAWRKAVPRAVRGFRVPKTYTVYL